MANKKALKRSPFDEEIEASIFGGGSQQKGKPVSRKTGVPANKQASEAASQQAGEPMVKMTIRLPKSLFVEFKRVHFELSSKQLEEQGGRVLAQDLIIQALREWIAKRKSGEAA